MQNVQVVPYFGKQLIKTFSAPLIIYRHEIAEASGLIAHSFGTEEFDRYLMFFKKVRSHH